MEQKTWTTTEELIKRSREVSEKATPGPWALDRKPRDPDAWPTDTIVASTSPGNGIYASPPGGSYPANDRVFIAEARTLVPALADALEAAIQPQWIPVSERLPEFPEGKHCVAVLVSGRWGVREAEWVNPIHNTRNKKPRWERAGSLLSFEPTHWMPMPVGPKEAA